MNDRVLLQGAAEDEGGAVGLVVREDDEDAVAAGGDVEDLHALPGEGAEGQGHGAENGLADGLLQVEGEDGEGVLDGDVVGADIAPDVREDLLDPLRVVLGDAEGDVPFVLAVVGVEHVDDIDARPAEGVEELAGHARSAGDLVTGETGHAPPAGEEDLAHSRLPFLPTRSLSAAGGRGGRLPCPAALFVA